MALPVAIMDKNCTLTLPVAIIVDLFLGHRVAMWKVGGTKIIFDIHNARCLELFLPL